MSGLFKKQIGGGGGAPTGAAGGDLTGSTYPNPVVATVGGVTAADLVKKHYFLRYTRPTGVPVGGTQYLDLGPSVVSSSIGERLPFAATLKGLTISLNVVDVTRDYSLQLLSDPAGAFAVLATLTVPAGTLDKVDRTYAVAIPSGTKIGARLIRTSGAGASTFEEVDVLVEITTP